MLDVYDQKHKRHLDKPLLQALTQRSALGLAIVTSK